MPLFPEHQADAIYFSMDDPSELMSRNSPYSFHLDDQLWPTIEHYYQAMKYTGDDNRNLVRCAPTAEKAKLLGNAKFRKKRKDLKQVKTVLMTRAVYTQAKTYSIIADRIINTGEAKLVENSQYDYYWGCGRDHRGDNNYGQVLMNVRAKLLEEQNG